MLWFYRDPTKYAQYESITNGYIKGFPYFTNQTFDQSSHQSERVTVQINTILALHGASFHQTMENISFQPEGRFSRILLIDLHALI